MPVASLRVVGVRASCMFDSLHSANIFAIEKVSAVHNAYRGRLLHNGCMVSRWKNHITARRKAAGLTMEQLAAAMDPPSSKGMISQYESGKRRPRQATLEAIAVALDCTPGELLDGEHDGPSLPNEADLEQMVALALQEVPAGSRLADYPPIVASSLRDQLRLYLKHGGFQSSSDVGTAPDTILPPSSPTRQGGREARRTP